MERGDKIVTLPDRLDAIETSIARLEQRVDRVFLMLAGLIGLANSPMLFEAIRNLF